MSLHTSGMATFEWRDDETLPNHAAAHLCRLLDVETLMVDDPTGALRLDALLGAIPALAVCRYPDQRIVLSRSVGVQSQRLINGNLCWCLFEPSAALPRGLMAGLCSRSAHDLRAVLTALTGWVDLAQLEGREDLDWAESLLAQLHQISDRLATAGQLQAGGVRLDPQSTSRSALQDALMRALQVSRFEPIQIICDSCHDDCLVDSTMLVWAATVLVCAARQRDRHGRIEVRVTCADNGTLLTVSDSGFALTANDVIAINTGATWQQPENLQRSSGVGISLLVAALQNIGGALTVLSLHDPTQLQVTLPRATTVRELE